MQSPFGPLFPSLCVLHVEPRNVFASRGKSSALRAETHHTRNFSVVLETLQLYSKFSILHLEFKCVCVSVLCMFCACMCQSLAAWKGAVPELGVSKLVFLEKGFRSYSEQELSHSPLARQGPPARCPFSPLFWLVLGSPTKNGTLSLTSPLEDLDMAS